MVVRQHECHTKSESFVFQHCSLVCRVCSICRFWHHRSWFILRHSKTSGWFSSRHYFWCSGVRFNFVSLGKCRELVRDSEAWLASFGLEVSGWIGFELLCIFEVDLHRLGGDGSPVID